MKRFDLIVEISVNEIVNILTFGIKYAKENFVKIIIWSNYLINYKNLKIYLSKFDRELHDNTFLRENNDVKLNFCLVFSKLKDLFEQL